MARALPLLKTTRFYPLFITQFCGAFNDNAFKNAFLIWFTYDIAVKTGANAPMMVTLAAGLFILPFFLLSATAGQVADAYEKSGLTRKIKQVEIILMLACALFFYLESVTGLLVVLCLMGVQSTFFGPIKYSLLPEHLREDELIAGNGLIEGGTFLSILLGTIVGGLVIRLDEGVMLLSCCVIVMAVTGWLASRAIPTAPVAEKGLKVSWNILRQTWKMIGFAREERTVWLSILGVSWFWLVGAVFLTQFPTYTKLTLGGNEHVVTLLLTVFSIGIGIGSVACNWLLRGKIDGRLVPYGCIGMSLSILDFYLASEGYAESGLAPAACAVAGEGCVGVAQMLMHWQGWRIMVDLLLLAIAGGVYIVPLYAIMQHRSDERHLARVIAANNVINALFMVLATLATVALFALEFHVNQLFLVVGVLNIPVWFIVRGVVKRRLGHA